MRQDGIPVTSHATRGAHTGMMIFPREHGRRDPSPGPPAVGVPPAAAEIAWAIGDELTRGPCSRTPRLCIVAIRGMTVNLRPGPVLPAARLPVPDAIMMLAEQVSSGRAPAGLARALQDPDAYGTAVICEPEPARSGAAAVVLSCTDQAGFAYEAITYPGPPRRTETTMFRPGTWHHPLHQALAGMTALLAPGPDRRGIPEPGR